MGLFGFGRKAKNKEAQLNDEQGLEKADQDTVTAEGADAVDAKETQSAAGSERGIDCGPWDVDDENIPDYDDYLDIGALYLPYLDGISLRLKANQEDGSVVGANVSVNGASLELEAFAAPKSQGLWDGVREDLLAANTDAKEVDGTFGKELMLPVHVGKHTVMTRVVGIDGPRWMLRGIFSGAAVQAGEMKDTFDQYLKDVVVERGEEPLAPRDLIPMHGPITPSQRRKLAEAQAAAEDGDGNTPLGQPDGPLTPMQQVETQTTLKRGPLFSEVR